MPLRKRIIPTLQLYGKSLVKTQGFSVKDYIGDPINTVRIFNELEVDELFLIDIGATSRGAKKNYPLLKAIASEAFMPLCYGGGISNMEESEQIFSMGFEKIVVNSAFFEGSQQVASMVERYGSQAVVLSIDYKVSAAGSLVYYTRGGREKLKITSEELEAMIRESGVGEIVLSCIDRDGRWGGYEVEAAMEVARTYSGPITLRGGCDSYEDIDRALALRGVTGASVGSLFLYQKRGNGVLVNMKKSSSREVLLCG